MVVFPKYSRTLVVGRSASGKSVLTNCIINQRSKLFETPINRVWYVSPKPVSTITAPGVVFLKEIPTNIPQNTLIVVDDSMMEPDILKQVARLSIREIHHTNSHLIVLVQRLYVCNPHYRVLMDQLTHVILFKLTKGFLTLSRFITDVFPTQHREYFWDAYKQATTKPYGYLMIDLSGESPLEECLYSKICDPKFIQYKKL
jgi:hypothetical protein